MKHFFTSCLLVSGLAFSAMAQEPLSPESAIVTPFQQQKSGIKRVENYLKNLTTLRADFQQVAPDGALAGGKFYLARPGKMRWEYAPPSPVLLVSDGDTLTYFDAELGQLNFISVDDTIAGFLAQENLTLDSEATRLVAFEAVSGVIRATIEQRDSPENGSLTLVFSDKPLRLSQFIIKDVAGNETNVSLSNIEAGVKLSEKLFIFKDPRGVVDKFRNK